MISSQAVGKALPSSCEEVSVRRVLAYAAAIADTSPAVFDDLGALTAPPAFCVSLEWPVLSHPDTRALLGAERAELLRGVHVTQDSSFHRPIRAGMRLVTRGTATGLRATSAGTLATLRVVTSDDAGPVVTSWVQSLYRGVGLDGATRESEPLPELPRPDPESRSAERVPIAIPREMPHVYSECARIWNPIHTERAIARAVGLPDIILHGTATWALAGRELVARYAGGDPTRLRRLRGRFRAMVIPGTPIELLHRSGPAGDGCVGIRFSVYNADGDEAIGDGFASVGL